MKLPFGRRGREILHISQVVRGLECNCQCPDCGADLVARKGPEVAHHFAHHETGECRFAPESALHWYAKHLIAVHPAFRTPSIGTVRENVLQVTESRLEQKIGDVIPDVQLNTDGGLLLAEIWVRNAVRAEKREALWRIQVPAVEIRLDDLSGDEALETIDAAVLADIGRRSWLYHPQLAEMERQRADQEAAVREERAQQQAAERARYAAQPTDKGVEDDTDNPPADEQYFDRQERAGLLLIEYVDDVDAAELDRLLRTAPPHDRTRLYCLFEPAEKLAYHCFLLGRPAKQLAQWCNEQPTGCNPFIEPSIVWRTGVLLKFAASHERFTVSDVVRWCEERYALRDFAAEATDAHGMEWDASGLSNLELAVFRYLDQLEHRGYVGSDGWIPRLRRYSPTGRFYPVKRRRQASGNCRSSADN